MLKEKARAMLEGKLIPFWSGLRDDEYGGYYGLLDFDLNLHKRAEKGCILNSRILWFFSRCAKDLNREDCREQADHAYAFLRDHCLDRTYGGVYWSLHYDGTPLDTTKHTYNQAFAIYALSAYYDLTGNQEALDTAFRLFDIIERRCRDEDGYLEAFDRTFQPESNEKLSENGVMAERTMNTLLHVFEGYSGLYQVTEDSKVRNALLEILWIYRNKIYNPTLKRQEVFFDREYHSLIDLHSYGHDIESSWLIDWGCGLLQEPGVQKTIFAMDQELAHKILERAYTGHSVLTECERGKDDTTRVWWVQAESVLGFLNAWQKEPECTAFRDAALDVWDYIERVMADPRAGSEWFWDVDAEGIPVSRKPIVEPWKCPYHNGRACLEIIRRDF